MSFEAVLAAGDLDAARTLLDELALQPETGGLYMSECYANLARSFERCGRLNDAITAMERAIEHGWSGQPDGRSDIAEFHLRAGRHDQAAQIWAQLKHKDPDEIWLYNAAGLSYNEIGEHQLAIDWLREGIELAIRTGDPQGLVGQLSDVRRHSLRALGREHDELEHRVTPFLEQWRAPEPEPLHTHFEPDRPTQLDSPPSAGDPKRRETSIAISWFPSGEYEQAIERWQSLAEDWANVLYPDYCHRLDGHIKWMRTHGIHVQAIAPIVIDEFLAWCTERNEDPENARADYAAQLLSEGKAIPWPPNRNAPCWCGSQRKYKKCCGLAPPSLMHGQEPTCC
jgi:tetratricopeptide (TPR) repeat protein